jgi:hypothetical protein
LDISNPKFRIDDKEKEYFYILIERLKDYCTKGVVELISCRNDSIKCNPIRWEKTTEPRGFGIPNEDEVVSQPYELNCTANAYGRIHGFFKDDTFNIVWFDPLHNLIKTPIHRN